MIFTAITRYSKDRKGLIVIYITLTLMGPLLVIGRIIDTMYPQKEEYSDYIAISIILLLVLVLFQMIYLALTHKGDEKSKRLLIIAFSIIVISAIPMLIMLILDFLGVL